MNRSTKLRTPSAIPDRVTERTFTDDLGTFFSATRGGADQRKLRDLVTHSLLSSTCEPDSLNARWLQHDSWHWTPHGTLAPDLIATDGDDCLALVLEAKSFSAAVNATSAARVRRAIGHTDDRLAQIQLTRDPRSVEISDQAVPTDPRWDVSHGFADCDGAGAGCLWHTSRQSAGVHQGDAYASQFAYLSKDISIPADGLESVDFIALLPSVPKAQSWGLNICSYERWHMASVGDLLCHLEDGRPSLPSDQRAWLDRLLAIARKLYDSSRGRLASRAELADAYRAAYK